VTFPVYLTVGSIRLHPHFIFEALAYATGFHVYRHLRARTTDPITSETRWTVIAAAAVGAAIGSKGLFWFEDPHRTLEALHTHLAYLMAGKTIVGGLLGGTVAVEIAKSACGERRSTGDLFVVPLCIGIAIGRLGCFLTGLDDHTYGSATMLPWGVDFGDGVARHPTQLYEALFVLGLAFAIARAPRSILRNGDRFKLFMLAYLGFRLAIDFLKPDPAVAADLSAIQWACVVGLTYYTPFLPAIVARRAGQSEQAVTAGM
jgi:phosphatidylglycerol---prolipoprotein diacylglyceryl transferase